jgi:hypothetical protein
MKFNKSLLAASVAAIAASGAHASTLDVSGVNTDFTVASELLAQNQDLSLDQAVNGVVSKDIVYTPSFGLNAGDLITFTFSNALYMNGDVKLIASELDNSAADIDNDGDGLDVVEVASNFGSLDATNGVSSVTVRVNNGLVLPTGTILRLVEDGDQLNQDGNNALASTDNIDVRVPAGTAAGTSVTVSASATNASNTTIGAAAATGDNTIIDIEQQIAVSITTAGTSTIEITADSTSRKEFTEEGGANDVYTTANDSDELASSALYTINNDSDNSVEVAYTATANDTVTFSVTATDVSGVSGVNVSLDGAQAALAGSANLDLTLANGVYSGTTTAAILPAQGATVVDDIVISVNGTDTLNERTWTTAFSVDYSATTVSDLSVAAATSHTWELDGGGAVLHTPMASLNSNFN